MSSVLITGFIECVPTAALQLSIIIFSACGSHEVRNLLMFLWNSDQVSVNDLLFKFSCCVIYSLNVIVLLSVLVLYSVTNYIHCHNKCTVVLD